MARDNVSQLNAESLLKIQLSDANREHLSDIVLENCGSRDELIKKVDQLHELFYQDVRVVGKSI